LFSSTAAALGDRAIAVVFDGKRDGTDGVQAIRANGGTIIAQDETTSAHFGVPSTAIKTGAVDYVLALSDIAPTLRRLLSEQAHE
jgi:two-component system chemotaxis response regulator CheB